MEFIISVIGSRTFNNKELIFNKLNILNNYLTIDKIISGGAIGPDTIGKEYAKNNNIKYIEYLPNWDKYGKKAGMIRNYDILKDSRLILAFYDNSNGTKHAIDLAHKLFKNIVVIDKYGYVNRDLSRIYRDIKYVYKWSRVVKRGEPYYECSSKGHKEYSAIFAKVDNKSIEEIYQLDIKGYRGKVEHWKEAKGKPTLNNNEDTLYKEYKKLWIKYFKNNKDLYLKLLKEAKDKTITDMFGIRPINQARTLADLCNNGLVE